MQTAWPFSPWWNQLNPSHLTGSDPARAPSLAHSSHINSGGSALYKNKGGLCWAAALNADCETNWRAVCVVRSGRSFRAACLLFCQLWLRKPAQRRDDDANHQQRSRRSLWENIAGGNLFLTAARAPTGPVNGRWIRFWARAQHTSQWLHQHIIHQPSEQRHTQRGPLAAK